MKTQKNSRNHKKKRIHYILVENGLEKKKIGRIQDEEESVAGI